MRKKRRDKSKIDSSPFPFAAAANPWGRIAPFLIITCIAIVYANSLRGVFILDDHVSIRQNMSIRKLFPLSIPLSPPENTSVSGRPILNLSFAFNYAISGVSVWSYHLVNVVVHIIAALFLYGIIRRTFLTPTLIKVFKNNADLLAMICAIIWAVHPLQTESVTYIIQRSESLAGMFYLGALYFFIRGANSHKALFWYGTAIISCALGMGTKEMVATAPVTILVYDYFFLTGSLRKALQKRLFLYIGLGCTWLILFWLAFGARSGSTGFGITGYGPLSYGLTQLGVVTRYLRLCFWPHPLVIDYLWFIEKNPVSIILPGILIGFLLFLTVMAAIRKLPFGFLGIWFFLILAPTSSFVPIPTEIAAERRMYLPLAAVVVAMILLIYHAEKHLWRNRSSFIPLKKPFGVAIAIACIVILGFLTMQRNRDYRDPEAMWKLVIRERPRNCRAYFNLGLFYLEHNRKEEAVRQLEKALECRHETVDVAEIHYTLARLIYEKGGFDEAWNHYEEALEIDPGNVRIMIDYGTSLALRNQLEKAEKVFQNALSLYPDNAVIHYNLGNVLEMRGRTGEAMKCYEESIRLDPDFPEPYRNLGDLLLKQGNTAAAVPVYEKALQLKPGWSEVQAAVSQIRKTKP
jgi:Tfp pilus assembly protein PilF